MDGIYYFKRFRFHDDMNVSLIRDWYRHLAVILLLELYALLIDDGNNPEADSQSGEGATRNIRRLMLDLNRQSEEVVRVHSIPFSNQPVSIVVDIHDQSVVRDPTTHSYLLNYDSDNDDANNEPAVINQEEEDDKEEKEVRWENYFGQTQPAYAPPAISRPYDHHAYFRTFNLDAMNLGFYGFQGCPDDEPVD
ncbi:hypothetical protein PIB30_039046 [Stylosanthes scabra]|uniref:Uncharacterized protein n=1 Tax=Stylosanthes scabra TaxID=79078 RepID=A0ABU6SF09_9FABA|nr:hypothetical protein [Stylosanthes scabra]